MLYNYHLFCVRAHMTLIFVYGGIFQVAAHVKLPYVIEIKLLQC